MIDYLKIQEQILDRLSLRGLEYPFLCVRKMEGLDAVAVQIGGYIAETRITVQEVCTSEEMAMPEHRVHLTNSLFTQLHNALCDASL